MKKFLAFVVALLLTISMIGCSTPATDNQDPSQANQGASNDNGEQGTDVENNGGDVVKGGILQLAETSGEANSLLWLNTSSYTDVVATFMIYETLFQLDASGNVVPYLCESYEADKENLTYTLHVREGILFQDGTPLDAEAVAWNLNTYKEIGVKSTGFLANFVEAEAIDDTTVVMYLSSWDSTIPNALTNYPGRMFSPTQYETYGAEYCETHPIGTGPFILESWERDVNKTYVKFEDYWQGEPNLDGIELTIYNDTMVAQAAFENGDIDAMYISDFSMAKALQDKGYSIVKSGQPTRIFMLCFNELDESDPLSNLLVRQAISHAIDKESIASTICLGFATPTNQFAYPGSVFYNEEVVGYEYDVEKAKELLAEAGYPDGLTTTLITRADTTLSNVAAAIQDQLDKIGITVEIDIVDGGVFSTVLTGWGKGMFEHNASLPTSITSQMNSIFRQGLTGNVLGITTMLRPDDVNDGIIAAVGAETEEEACAEIRNVQKLMFDNYCIFTPIVVTYDTIVKNDRLQDDGINEITINQNTLWKAWISE